MKKKIIVLLSAVIVVCISVSCILFFNGAKPIEYNNRLLAFSETIFNTQGNLTIEENFIVRDNIFIDCIAAAAETNDLGYTDIGELYETSLEKENFSSLTSIGKWNENYSAEKLKAIKVLRADDLNDADSGTKLQKGDSYRLIIITKNGLFVCRINAIESNLSCTIYKVNPEKL